MNAVTFDVTYRPQTLRDVIEHLGTITTLTERHRGTRERDHARRK